ncbi:MAG: hypothetical protein RIS36_1581 [Pseudomonadota bacterium]
MTLMIGACVVMYGSTGFSETQSKRDERFGVGSSLREVLASWGEPEERVVRGVKQELVWNYKGGARVVFKHGKVSSFRTGDAQKKALTKKAAELEPVRPVGVESEESRDILRDIVREIPSGSDGPLSGGALPSSDPNLAGLIPNAVPSQRGGGAGIAPGVVVPSPDEEEQ